MKFIDYNEEGDIVPIHWSNDYDAKGDRYEVAYGNRQLLNDWCSSDFNFQVSNGVGTDNFFCKESWFVKAKIKNNNKYFWGWDTINKIDPQKNINSIFGACPFVYTKDLFTDRKFDERYTVVFLPKSDLNYKMQLLREYTSCMELIKTLKELNSNKTIYIAYTYDFEYYQNLLPSELKQKTYCFGSDAFDSEWSNRVLKTIRYAKKLYFNLLSTSCVYSVFLNKDVDFYRANVQGLPEDWNTEINPHRQYCFSNKPAKFFEFMDYIQNVFTNKTKETDFWLHWFLSLDLIKKPEDLYHDLLCLHDRDLDNKQLKSINMFDNSHYSKLIEKVNSLKVTPSDTTDLWTSLV